MAFAKVLEEKINAVIGKKIKKDNSVTENFILNDDSPFLMKEDYKALRTNLTFAFPDKPHVCIAVTSSNRAEGKSTTSINLAISWAQMGKRVLIVDCDLRLPTVAEKLGLDQRQLGLSDLLMGSCKPSEVLKRYEGFGGLYVLQSGTISADPIRLLSSESMVNLLGTFRELFDYIILDCPPVNMVVDACVLARNIDGYLVVVRHNTTEYKDLDQALTQLEKSNANVIGWAYVDAETEDKKYYRKGGYYYK